MTDLVETFIQSALAPLGYPVSQTPGDASQHTWITWNLTAGRGLPAANEWTRIRHTFQLHVYTHGQEGEHRTAFFAALDALRARGVRIFSWGPDDYEKDTGVCHIACTCVWLQREEVR